EFKSAQIILFYSPLGESKAIRGQIVMYWFIEDFVKGDFLALYHGSEDKFLFIYHPAEMSGYIKTGVLPSKENYLMDSTYVEQCTGYIGAWFRNDILRKSSCLSTHPDWMSKHRDILMNMTLQELFIPGTHSSGSYSEELPPTILQRYTITQENSIMDQLLTGIRYLDIRPCIVDNKYWVCHGTFAMQPLEAVITDMRDFLNNTMEIVIVNFKEFPRGFETFTNHSNFLSCLVREFKGYFVIPYEAHPKTLGEIWKSNMRLFISYITESEGKTDRLWTSVMQQWGNVKNVIELDSFIDRSEIISELKSDNKSRTKDLRAVMAEITLDSSMIIVDAALYYFGRGRKSLRELAVQTGPLVTMWYKQKHFKTANIVAVDFIDTTGIIEVAIWSNIYRAKCDVSN
ncbi:GSCOCG00002856001-RA-CDS, partial [Cotesia congregata]